MFAKIKATLLQVYLIRVLILFYLEACKSFLTFKIKGLDHVNKNLRINHEEAKYYVLFLSLMCLSVSFLLKFNSILESSKHQVNEGSYCVPMRFKTY